MRSEASEPYQLWRPAGTLEARSKADALEELLKPCGRFKIPVSAEERMQANLSRALWRFDPLEKNELVRAPAIPLNWQVLLRYLYREGVIGDPSFHFPHMPNDVPKMISGWVSPRYDETGRLEGGGFASSNSLEEVISRAIGEVIERHFFSTHTHIRFAIHSYNQIRRKRTLDLENLNRFLPWQEKLFPWFKRDFDAPMKWIIGEELETGKKINIPAQLVFWKYPLGHSRENALMNPTTSGSAGHFTAEEALLASLLELVQRDGFLLYWLNTLSPKVIDVSKVVDKEFSDLLSYVKRYRLNAYFLNTTSDIHVPSVTCVLIDTLSEEPTIALGAGTGFSLSRILLQAAREAISVYTFLARASKFELPKNYEPFRDASISRNERVAAWKGKDMLKRFEFFVSGQLQDPNEFIGNAWALTTVGERLAYLLHTFKEKGKGYEVYAYEIKNRVLDRIGYHLVHAVVPQLFPLYLMEHMPTLDSKRLREVPEKLGYKVSGELNPWPHPFP